MPYVYRFRLSELISVWTPPPDTTRATGPPRVRPGSNTGGRQSIRKKIFQKFGSSATLIEPTPLNVMSPSKFHVGFQNRYCAQLRANLLGLLSSYAMRGARPRMSVSPRNPDSLISNPEIGRASCRERV